MSAKRTSNIPCVVVKVTQRPSVPAAKRRTNRHPSPSRRQSKRASSNAMTPSPSTTATAATSQGDRADQPANRHDRHQQCLRHDVARGFSHTAAHTRYQRTACSGIGQPFELPTPALENVICRLAQITDGRRGAFPQRDVAFDRPHAISHE